MRQTFDDHASPDFGARHLPRIRAEMARQGLDAFVIPHEDEHGNEYLPAANERLAWATGFTGSAGAAVVRLEDAAVFSDGRYTLQLAAQTDPQLFARHDTADGGVAAWLKSHAAQGQVIGYDPRLHSPDALQRLRDATQAKGAELRAVQSNPVDLAWGEERPPQPRARVTPHALEHAGEESAAKRARVGEAIREAGADAAVLTAPSSIAWLFNVRGGDVIRSPLPIAQAILRTDGTARLFLDPEKGSDDLRGWLGNQVTVEGPDAAEGALGDLKGLKVLVDPAQSSAWWFDALERAGATPVKGADPVASPRAAKNPAELKGARSAHLRDAAAFARFLHWLATEGQVSPPDEIETVTKLEALREATGALKDLSFDTIAGAGPNGAVVHYRPTRATNRRAQAGELLLVDSGAQYEDGTTDITRTVAIGAPSDEQSDRFTRVLKGHIALSRARFPVGTPGAALDSLAREPLWAAGLDYDHGTGHGVGSYLGVHEGPQRIDKAGNLTSQLNPATRLQPGMILSNEPGYYKAGAYGIRIENLVAVTPAEQVGDGDRPMMGFEVLTLAPIDRRLIDAALLDAAERAWVDAYHARVLAEVAPLVEAEVADWLEEACAPL
ncbi:MAG: aminopeptidase P family protein [Caulobacteraceae bacterium]|nr:aminopeptidase P family protein [Caulobacter sp.]